MIKINYLGDFSGSWKDGCSETFSIDEKDPVYQKLYEVDFEKLITNPALKLITLKDYFVFSEAVDQDDIRISFAAKYDKSIIILVWENYDDSPVNIEFIWYNDNVIGNDQNKYIKPIQEEVIPELIEKILNIA